MRDYNKLVRDRIPEIIAASGAACETRVATLEEYGEFLLKKLEEESEECAQARNRTELLTELADLMEVVHGICDHFDMDMRQVDATRSIRAKERGAFKDRIILLKS